MTDININLITKQHDIEFWIKRLESILEVRQQDYSNFGEMPEDTEQDNKIKDQIQQLKNKII